MTAKNDRNYVSKINLRKGKKRVEMLRMRKMKVLMCGVIVQEERLRRNLLGALSFAQIDRISHAISEMLRVYHQIGRYYSRRLVEK